jgi:ribose-phosphate pyrophosphokinase
MIRAINLDSMFVPTSFPEIEFKLIKFSGGELQPRVNKYIDYTKVEKVIITHRIRSGNDFLLIALVKNALMLYGITHFDLIIPYLPYARQDRVASPGESYALEVYANLINSLQFDNVRILDVHNPSKTAELINNLTNKSNEQFVQAAINHYNSNYTNKNLILIAPDKGSTEKCKQLMDANIGFKEMIQCTKVRDALTGKLSGFFVETDDLKGQDCMIVDDICDGGGTFIGVAEELKKHNCGKLFLFVTHGIFSKGFDELNKYFEKIYCTNSFSDLDSNTKLIQLKIRY